MANETGQPVRTGSSSVVPIAVALIGAGATVTVAVVANWRNIFAEAEDAAVGAPEARADRDAASSAADPGASGEGPHGATQGRESSDHDLGAAERVVSLWFDAKLRGDIDGLVAVSMTPFYFRDEVVVSEPQLRARYQTLVRDLEASRVKGETATIAAFKPGTAHDFSFDTLRPPSRAHVLESFRVEPEDIVIRATLRFPSGREEIATYFVRDQGDGLRLFAFGE